jgi:MATE family multidrug resistance protein
MTTSADPTSISRNGHPTLGGVREVAVLAYPVILTQISVTTTQLVDSAMVGRLGSSELAAVGFGGIWMWTVICFFMGTTTAVQTFVSQYQGAGEEHRCGAWTWQGVYIMAPLTTLAAVTLFFGAGTLMTWLGPSEAIRPLATQYLEARSFGSVGLCAAIAVASFFRGIGDTRTPLYAMLVANGLNALLDYGLIFGRLGLPAWGVTGAGVATTIAEWVYFAGLLAFFARGRLSKRFATALAVPDWSQVRRLLRTGLPIGGQWCLEMTSFAAFSTLVVRMGDAPMAASQAFIILLAISFMQAIGISMAVATLVGRYIGARNLAAAEHSFRSGVKLGVGLAGLVAALYVAIPELLLRIFTDDPAVLELARPLLLVGAVFQLFDAISIVADGALRGAGDTRWPFAVRFVLAWGLFVPLSYALGISLGFGLTGAWVGGAIYVAVLAAFLVQRFRSGAWQQIAI